MSIRCHGEKEISHADAEQTFSFESCILIRRIVYCCFFPSSFLHSLPKYPTDQRKSAYKFPRKKHLFHASMLKKLFCNFVLCHFWPIIFRRSFSSRHLFWHLLNRYLLQRLMHWVDAIVIKQSLNVCLFHGNFSYDTVSLTVFFLFLLYSEVGGVHSMSLFSKVIT